MTRVEADIEAIKALREALLRFAGRQKAVLDAAEREIADTLRRLEQSEQRWRREVERRNRALQECRQRAAYAAREGGYVDCSGYAHALQEAQERLHEVMRQRARVEEAAAQYRRAAQRLLNVLQNELPRATGFLADRIAALEAYYAMQVTTATMALATALAAIGALGVMGGVIGAIRRSQGELSRLMGSMGEQVAAQVLSERFGLEEVPFDQPKHGFDRVFRAPGIPLIVMESKVSSSGRLQLGQTQAGEQGSPAWIAAQAARMTDPSSAQWSPANERIGRLVQELGPENVPTVAVVTNPNTETVDVYVRGDAGWQLLESGIRLDEFTARSRKG